MTGNIERRLFQHKTKFFPNSFSARYNVNRLVYFEPQASYDDAMAREKQIKGWGRWKKIRLSESVNPNWRDLTVRAKMSDKTLAMRFLEGKKIPYETATYDISTRDAEEVAALVGADPAQVFKTLVVARKPEKSILVMVPADKQLNLKKLAKAVGAKKLKMASQQEAEKLTGLKVGGISPLALVNKGFSIMADRSLLQPDKVYLSSGQRGIQIIVAPQDVVRVTKAKLAELV